MADSLQGPLTVRDATDPLAQDGEVEAPELSVRVLGGLPRYLVEQRGKHILEEIAARERLSADELLGTKVWFSAAKAERLLAHARECFADDESFRRSFGYRMADSLGLMRYVFMAASPASVIESAIRSIDRYSTLASLEILAKGDTSIRVRYRSKGKESRLLCYSRSGITEVLPTIWGMPPARFTENSCIAWGDPSCDYLIEWNARARILPVLGGFAAGGVATMFTHLLGVDSPAAWASWPMVGTFLSLWLESKRAHRVDQQRAFEAREALQALGREQDKAHREVLELNQRQRQWLQLMEQQIAERTESLRKVVTQLGSTQHKREVALMGMSHDLRNPLAVLKTTTWALKRELHDSHPDIAETLVDQEQAIGTMEKLLGELVTVTKAESKLVRFQPQTLSVSQLSGALKRRLQALVFGREIRTSVFSSREAPETIHIDPIFFDRIIDNLLTNAVKYTERGSILLEVTGTEGFMVVKISDTGRGIDEVTLKRIFRPDASDPTTRAPGSFGVGLSVVVRLLAQCGGRLEVMSQPGVGTTFWVFFPVEASQPRPSAPPNKESWRPSLPLEEVVAFRRPASG